MNILKNERGVSLLEVVATIVIISIVLLSFSQFFIQTKKTAAYNNEKLVTINLADAALAKLQHQSFSKSTNPTPNDLNKYFNSPNIEKKIPMNNKEYTVTYEPSQSNQKHNSLSEQELGLIKVVVTVIAPDQKTKGVTEGYVKIEQ